MLQSLVAVTRLVQKLQPQHPRFFRICTVMTDKSTLFQSADMADAYLKYRPTYGPDVFSAIMEFCMESPSCDFSQAVDVGCGFGQSTVPLSRRFKSVIGLDNSKEQIAKAPHHLPNLTFRTGKGEDLSFAESGSVDLVTVAQAIHWMDTATLYPEVERVLKPGGAFVVYGYGMVALDKPEAQATLAWFYKDILGPYWTQGRDKVEEHYRSYTLPFPNSKRNDSFTIEREWTVDEFIGYLCSWSAYHLYMVKNPLTMVMPEVKHRLKESYPSSGDWRNEPTMKVSWPVFMLMGHKPASP